MIFFFLFLVVNFVSLGHVGLNHKTVSAEAMMTCPKDDQFQPSYLVATICKIQNEEDIFEKRSFRLRVA